MSTPPSQPPEIPSYGAPYVAPTPSPASGEASPQARVLSGIAGGVLAVLLLGVGSTASAYAMRRVQRLELDITTTGPMLLLGLISVIIAACLGMTIKFSSLGAYVGGGLLLLIGVIGVLDPTLMYRLSSMLRGITMGMDILLWSGAPILIGAVLIGAGLGGSMIRRASAARR